MASTSRDSLNVWKSEGEKTVPILEFPGVFEMVAFSKNNSRIAAFGNRRSDLFRVWDISTGKSATPVCMGDSDAKLPSPAAMTFLDDGKFVAVAFKGGMLVIWDAVTCAPVKIAHLVVSQNSRSVFRDHNGYEPMNYTGLAVFSTKEPTLVTANTQYNYSTKKYEVGEVHLWDLSQVDLGSKMADKSGKINDSFLKDPIRLMPKLSLLRNLPGQLIAATFSNELKLLLRNQNDGTLKVIGEAGQTLAELDGKNFDDAIIAAFSSDGQRIVAADRSNQEIKIWNANNGDLILNASSFIYQFNKVAISANGESFAVGDNYGTVRTYPSTVEGFLDLASRLVSESRAP